MGLIPGLGTQILHALRCGKKKKKEKKNLNVLMKELFYGLESCGLMSLSELVKVI